MLNPHDPLGSLDWNVLICPFYLVLIEAIPFMAIGTTRLLIQSIQANLSQIPGYFVMTRPHCYASLFHGVL